METINRTCIGQLSYATMKFCGAAIKNVKEGFYFIAPFMRHSGVSTGDKRKPVVERPAPVVVAEPVVKPVIVEKMVTPVVSSPKPEESKTVWFREAKPEIKEETRTVAFEKAPIFSRAAKPEEKPDKILRGVTFANKLERVKSEVYVNDFRSKISKVREDALEQLKKLPKPVAVGVMSNILNEETDILKQVELLNALTAINDDCSISKSIFTSYLQKSSSILRMAALRGIAKYKDEAAFITMNEMVKTDEAEVRRQALNLLYWTYGKRVTASVMMALHDVDNHVRRTAIQIAGGLRLQQAVSPLITYLSDPSDEVQKSSVEVLRKITGKDFGFKAKGSQKEKKDAIESWRFWWRDNQTKMVQK
jgi:HEAT repeats